MTPWPGNSLRKLTDETWEQAVVVAAADVGCDRSAHTRLDAELDALIRKVDQEIVAKMTLRDGLVSEQRRRSGLA